MGKTAARRKANSTTTSRALIASRDSIRGNVTRIFFSKDGWTAGKIETPEGKAISFAGNIVVSQSQPVILHGSWHDDAKYGRQFKATSVELDRAMDAHGLGNYLANNPAFKGIGPARAWQIAEMFGSSFEETLLSNPEAIAIAVKVPVGIILELQATWTESQSVNRLMTELSSYELTHHQATTLVETLGGNAVGMLLDNPYRLIHMIYGFGFKRVDKIALRAGIAKDNVNRLDAGILEVITVELDGGSTYTEYQEVIERANGVLILDSSDSRDIIQGRLDAMIDEKRLIAHGCDSGILVGLPWCLEVERELEGYLRDASLTSAVSGKLCLTSDNITTIESRLNPEQVSAVAHAFERRISIITGGAGTGKTFTVETICNIAESNDLTVTLCASTGKAAKRMTESSGRPAMTVHRLIGWQGGSLRELSPEMITADIVIMDEASMVDVELAVAFFRCIDPTTTSVVLVGDHNQLPPVGPGAVLRDIIASNVVPVTKLETVVRQAGVLKENSTAILRGEVNPSAEKPDANSPAPWYVISHFREASDIRDFIGTMFASWIAPNGKLPFDILRDIQVLTPTHKGDAGTESLNAMIQTIIQRKLYGIDVEASRTGKARPLPGDKVICTKNNYSLDLMNGTVGILTGRQAPVFEDEDDEWDDPFADEDGVSSVSSVPTKPTKTKTVRCIDLGGGELVDLTDDAMKDIQLAYALTIHKAQGSEFPCAVVVAHKSHAFMSHRNLMYTGVTRASKTAIILGDSWGIRNCAAKIQANTRRTFLSILLSGASNQ